MLSLHSCAQPRCPGYSFIFSTHGEWFIKKKKTKKRVANFYAKRLNLIFSIAPLNEYGAYIQCAVKCRWQQLIVLFVYIHKYARSKYISHSLHRCYFMYNAMFYVARKLNVIVKLEYMLELLYI